MTNKDGQSSNKFDPKIGQDGKDIKVDLEGSMPNIAEAPDGVPEET